MGVFDDVLAMEPGDEWDVPLDDAVDDEELLPDLVMELRLPGAVVELRGDVPPPLIHALEPLRDTRLITDDTARWNLVVSFRDGGWHLEGTGLEGRQVDGVRIDDLFRSVLTRLDEMVLETDPSRLHLASTVLEIDGTGVLLVSEGAGHTARTVEHLLRDGARLVTQRLLTLQPGSHTVFGYPAPSSMGAIVGDTAPYTAVDVVVHLSSGSPSEPMVERVGVAESCIRLLDVAVDRDRFGPAALEVLGTTASGASHWELRAGDPATAAAAVRALHPPLRRAFWVVHRYDEPPSAGPQPAGSLRVAWFDDGAVALDAVSGKVLRLSEDEIDALEELLVEGARPRQSIAARLRRLSDAGMYVPDERTRRPVPGPEAFGLPNCPTGSTARSMWSEQQDRTEAVRGTVASGTDSSTVLAVLRGVLPGDEELRRRAVETHQRLQDEVVDVERHLLRTVSVLEAAGIEPLVLGSVVHAHDGPLPPYFAGDEEIDLLVHDGELGAAIAALQAAGYVRTGFAFAVEDDSDDGVVDLVPATGTGPSVRLRDTLAVGPFGALVDHEEFHRRAVPIRIHGRWCRSLHPEHRFVHACMKVEFDEEPTTQAVRDVVLAAPRADAAMAGAIEASERWGATATVTSAVRRVDTMLPGLPPWLVQRSKREDVFHERPRRRRFARRGRRRERAERLMWP